MSHGRTLAVQNEFPIKSLKKASSNRSHTLSDNQTPWQEAFSRPNIVRPFHARYNFNHTVRSRLQPIQCGPGTNLNTLPVRGNGQMDANAKSDCTVFLSAYKCQLDHERRQPPIGSLPELAGRGCRDSLGSRKQTCPSAAHSQSSLAMDLRSLWETGRKR